jgi:hypothetical protein
MIVILVFVIEKNESRMCTCRAVQIDQRDF